MQTTTVSGSHRSGELSDAVLRLGQRPLTQPPATDVPPHPGALALALALCGFGVALCLLLWYTAAPAVPLGAAGQADMPAHLLWWCRALELPVAGLVLAGGLLALAATCPVRSMGVALRMGWDAFCLPIASPRDAVNAMVRLAEVSRRDGLGALYKVRSPNPALRQAARLVAETAPVERLVVGLGRTLNVLHPRNVMAVALWRRLGVLVALVGLFGTGMGLARLMPPTDAWAISGPEGVVLLAAVARALTSAFWGAMLALVVCWPVARRLRARAAQEERLVRLLFAGAQAILENNNPRLVRRKLAPLV